MVKRYTCKHKSYVLTVLLSLLIIFSLSTLLGIYPFGDKMLLWIDGDQYLSFQQYISSNSDILYSWSNILGQGAYTEMAYYAFSPFNLLMLLFKNHLVLGTHIILYIKIIMCSLTFCYMLNKISDNDEVIKSLFSISYAFMGYVIFYAWNSSWIDGIILLPLIFVGLLKVIKENKNLLYIIALAIGLISNFYIGYMLCIGSLILFVLMIFYLKKDITIDYKKTIVNYVIGSIMAVGLSCFVLIPVYYGLPKNRSISITKLFRENSFISNPSNVLSGVFTGQINDSATNLPLIFTGIMSLSLIIMFFVNRKIHVVKKIVISVVIVIFFISFNSSFINALWHGLSINYWFNYRYSFIFSFILLLVAYISYLRIKEEGIDLNDIFKSLLVLIILAYIVITNASSSIRPNVFIADIILIIILLLIYSKGIKKIGLIVISFITIINIVFNAYVYLKDIGMYSVKEYNDMKEVVNGVKTISNDGGFYRMEKTVSFGRNDASLYGYNGTSNYSSTENISTIVLANKLGIHRKNEFHSAYSYDVPMATDSLLGIKYVISNKQDNKDYTLLGNRYDINYYKNEYALPIVFPVSQLLTEGMDNLNYFELQNLIWKSINNNDSNVFEKNTIKDITNEKYKVLEVTAESDGKLYINIPNIKGVSFDIHSSIRDEYIICDHSNTYFVGDHKKGDKIQIVIYSKNGDYDISKIDSYTEINETIVNNVKTVMSEDIIVTKNSNSKLTINYTGNKKLVATTIPYDDQWSISDNGKQIKTIKNMGGFIAFELTEGNSHEIVMSYTPKGLTSGIVVSSTVFVGVVAYLILKKRLNNKMYK